MKNPHGLVDESSIHPPMNRAVFEENPINSPGVIQILWSAEGRMTRGKQKVFRKKGSIHQSTIPTI